MEGSRLWYYKELTPASELELERRLRRDSFRDELDFPEPVSASTINRMDERIRESVRDHAWQYHNDEVERVLVEIQGTDWEDLFTDPPEIEVETDGASEPIARVRSRELRKKVFPYIPLDRNQSVSQPKQLLLKLLDIAGTHSIHPSGAADILAGKGWLQDVDTPDAQDLFYHVNDLDRTDITRHFLAANEKLFEIAKQYDTFTDKVVIAIDITDWPWYGRQKPRFVSGTKPGRNYSYAWQFITLGVVGTYAPMQLVALPVRTRSNSPAHVRRLLNLAEEILDIDEVYLDSGFYSQEVTAAVLEHDVEFITQAEMKGSDIKGLVYEAIEDDLPYNSMPYGVRDRAANEYMFVLPSEKKSQRRKSEPDDPTDDWVAFYSSMDPEEYGAEELGERFRNRWGIETSYRVIKQDFLPQSGAERVEPRHFMFNYALTLYNTWVVANLQGAAEGDYDLAEEKVHKAATYMALLCDDSAQLTEREIEDVSEVSDILKTRSWF